MVVLTVNPVSSVQHMQRVDARKRGHVDHLTIRNDIVISCTPLFWQMELQDVISQVYMRNCYLT